MNLGHRGLRLLVAACLLTTSCGLMQSSASSDESTDADQTLVRRLVAADNARDLAAVLSCCTDDAVWNPPHENSVQGKDAIRRRYEQRFAKFTVQMSVEIALFVRGAGRIETARGYIKGTLVPVDGSAPVAVDDLFAVMIRLDSGAWRIFQMVWGPRGNAHG